MAFEGCGTWQERGSRREEASIEANAQRNDIIERLIPADGLHPSRRQWLIDATASVLTSVDKEELLNPTRLRGTLQDASLSNLRRIEAAYKQRADDAGN